jgi:uncharacterized protein YbjT (DUF2867 family)
MERPAAARFAGRMTTAHRIPTRNALTVVLGGTGKTGRRVADRLERLGHPVVRAARGGERYFDWSDEATWASALDGASAVYVAYSPDLAAPGGGDAVAALAALAARAGVRRAVLLSGRGEVAARAAERAFLAELPHADVVRCAWFDQNFTEGLLAPSVAAGTIALPAPGSAVEPFVDADDIADCAVHLLTAPEPVGGVHELTGPEALRLEELATTLTAVTGHAVRYEEASVEEFAGALGGLGLDPDAAVGLAATFAELLDGRNAEPTHGVEDVLGRPARSFAAFARDAAGAGLLTVAA